MNVTQVEVFGESDMQTFQNKINAFCIVVKEKGGAVRDIKYASTCYDSNNCADMFSALVIYEIELKSVKKKKK